MRQKILVTGGCGFLGKHIKKLLDEKGADVKSLGRGSQNDIICNVTDGDWIINDHFDIVVHAAGKAHISPQTKSEKGDFFSVNVKGTENLLSLLEKSGIPSALIFISSVTVYGMSSGILINEEMPLMANDPYGLSKIEAERIVLAWCLQNNVRCTIFRLPLIAGPNPPGNLGAMIKGIRSGYYFNIGGGIARKSIVLAEDVAAIILKAAEGGGVYNLTDGCHPSFTELSESIAKQLNKNKPANIPIWLARVISKAGDLLGSKAPINSNKLRKITSDLTFDDSKAHKLLGWNPTPVLEGFKIS